MLAKAASKKPTASGLKDVFFGVFRFWSISYKKDRYEKGFSKWKSLSI